MAALPLVREPVFSLTKREAYKLSILCCSFDRPPAIQPARWYAITSVGVLDILESELAAISGLFEKNFDLTGWLQSVP